MNQADVSKLVSKLRIRIKPKHRQFPSPEGPEGRLRRLRQTVTALFKYERIELNYNRADEARGYAERLISDAIRHGDTHEVTMEMATYWLDEKQLVHKLFKVLAPRYKDYGTSYTMLYKAPKRYPEIVYPRSVLELRGNPFPPLIFDTSRNRNFIHNVLMDEARKDYKKDKYKDIAEKVKSLEIEHSINLQEEVKLDGDEKSKAAEQVTEGEQLLKMVEQEDLDQRDDELPSDPDGKNPAIV